MPTDLEPAELARLVDFAERPRVDDWSLRAAMVRYAQPQPERASRILDLVRRTEGALHGHGRDLRERGHVLWDAYTKDQQPSAPTDREVVGILTVAAELDRVGELLASWAAAWPAERPDADLDAIAGRVEAELDRLGVAPDGPPPQGFGGRRRGA